MTKECASERVPKVLRSLMLHFFLPGFAFGVTVCFATRSVGLASFVTGLAMSGALVLLWEADRVLLQPRLKSLPRDWLRFGLENTFSVLEHFFAPLLALIACGYIFGFAVEANTAWIALGSMLIGFPIIHGTSNALSFYRELKEKEQREQRLQELATQAELTALKAQINPHFLFNTLNTIAQLIHTDSDQAEATVERLAEMFRYLLNGSERGMVPLEEELNSVDVYLQIEKARFGDRLRVTRHIAPEVLSVPVPSLVLQPLVENSVRHGRGTDGSISLAVYIHSHGDEVIIDIADEGPGMPPGHWIGGGPGHGLRNVDERLRKTYGQGYGLKVSGNQPTGAIVTVRIPAGGGE